MSKIRKGDTVQVIAGKDKGVTGKVLRLDKDASRVLVEGVNRVLGDGRLHGDAGVCEQDVQRPQLRDGGSDRARPPPFAAAHA